jgi:hypothetical protein
MRRPVRLVMFVTCAFALGTAAPARADALDQILDAALPLLDSDLAQARPFVRCVVEKGTAPAAVQACAAQFAKGKASSVTAGNSKLNDVVAIVKAIQAHDWISVLDRTGTDLLVKLACSAGMPPAGPLKGFLCSSVSAELAKLAKPVLRTALEAVRDQNWPKLMAAVPTLACQIDIIPLAVRATVCSGIDIVLTGGLAAFNAMVNGLADQLSNALSMGDRLLGSDVKKQTPKQYFVDWWIPYLHKGVWLKFVQGDAAFSTFVNGRVSACAQYYGTSSPCGPMKTIYVKAVDTATATLKASVPLHYEAKVKPDLFYHDLFWLSSKGKYAGFSWGDSSSCMSDLMKQVPIPECDGLQECRPRPTVWAEACKGVQTLLVSNLQTTQPAFDQKIAQVSQQGCVVRTDGFAGFFCTTYSGSLACEKALPAHMNVCSLDQQKAAQTFAAGILVKLGPKRCGHPGTSSWELVTVECTRPWKLDTCESLVAAGTPPKVNTKVLCKLRPDPAFDAGKTRAKQVVDVLNSGKTILSTGGGATIMGSGTPISFKPAGCSSAHPDPLQIRCTEWNVVKEVASQVASLGLKPCPQDPKSDGVDEACYQFPLTLGPPGNVVAKPVLPPAIPPSSPGRVAVPTPTPTPAARRR